MILLDKYSDINSSVLSVSAALVDWLAKAGYSTISELESIVKQTVGESAVTNLSLALTFLFSTGNLVYHASSDTVSLSSDRRSDET